MFVNFKPNKFSTFANNFFTYVSFQTPKLSHLNVIQYLTYLIAYSNCSILRFDY